jgi:hypothetical protein
MRLRRQLVCKEIDAIPDKVAKKKTGRKKKGQEETSNHKSKVQSKVTPKSVSSDQDRARPVKKFQLSHVDDENYVGGPCCADENEDALVIVEAETSIVVTSCEIPKNTIL